MMLTPPLTMMGFFHKSEGIWYTQRTVHHFDTVADESGESKLHVSIVASEDERIRHICESQGIDSSSSKRWGKFHVASP